MISSVDLLLNNYFSYEIRVVIKSYLVNEIAYKMLQEYFNYLYYKKELYENFCYTQYIRPNCYCRTYYNSNAQRWKTRDCRHCDELEYSDKFIPNDFLECIRENPQYEKIATRKIHI
jgi:hypothetical protein